MSCTAPKNCPEVGPVGAGLNKQRIWKRSGQVGARRRLSQNPQRLSHGVGGSAPHPRSLQFLNQEVLRLEQLLQALKNERLQSWPVLNGPIITTPEDVPLQCVASSSVLLSTTTQPSQEEDGPTKVRSTVWDQQRKQWYDPSSKEECRIHRLAFDRLNVLVNEALADDNTTFSRLQELADWVDRHSVAPLATAALKLQARAFKRALKSVLHPKRAPRVPRTLPEVGGPSFDATLFGGKTKADDLTALPVKVRSDCRVAQKRAQFCLGVPSVTTAAQVDEELLAHLQYEVLFVNRTPSLMTRLATKAKAYLRKFDLRGFRQVEINEMVTRAVVAAMSLSFEEQVGLDRLSNLEDAFQRSRLNAVLHTGSAPAASNVVFETMRGTLSHLPMGKPTGGLLSAVAEAVVTKAVGEKHAARIVGSVNVDGFSTAMKGLAGRFRKDAPPSGTD